jgi:hypothetical protein
MTTPTIANPKKTEALEEFSTSVSHEEIALAHAKKVMFTTKLHIRMHVSNRDGCSSSSTIERSRRWFVSWERWAADKENKAASLAEKKADMPKSAQSAISDSSHARGLTELVKLSGGKG